MNKTIRSVIIRVTVSFALILLLLYIMRGKYGEIAAALKGTSLPVFCAGLAIFITALFVASFRLKLIIDAQGGAGVTFLEALSLTFIGYFFNNFLPTSIGGDVVKAYYQSKKSGDRTASYTSVFVDRAIGLFTMIFMAFAALFFVDGRIIDNNVKNMLYCITAVSVLIIVFMMNKNIARKFGALLSLVKPLEGKLIKFYNAVNRYQHHYGLLVQSFGISIISQLLFFTSIGVLALSIGSRISIMDILLKMPIISIMSMLPSINGLGLREGSTVLFFGPVIGNQNAFAVSVLWLVALLIISVMGGLIYGLSPQFKMKLKEIESEAA